MFLLDLKEHPRVSKSLTSSAVGLQPRVVLDGALHDDLIVRVHAA
jgi:hypothetical protein